MSPILSFYLPLFSFSERKTIRLVNFMVFCLNQRAAACPATRLYIYMGRCNHHTAPDPLMVLCHG